MAMDELSPSLSPSPSPSPIAGVDNQWAPHGQLLTGCLVALNVLIVLLIYFYFWRFFSRKGEAASADRDGSASSAASSPALSPKARNRHEVERAITALPVFVHSSSSSSSSGGGGADEGSKAVECAICIAEFSDGEEGRLLPRCGHRFHAGCVDMWFHFHTTCPLCRASVLAAVEPKSDTDMDTDCPV